MASDFVFKVSPNAREGIREVARHLENAGVDVQKVLDGIGIISGRMDDSLTSKMREIDGIQFFRKAMRYRAVPPVKKPSGQQIPWSSTGKITVSAPLSGVPMPSRQASHGG